MNTYEQMWNNLKYLIDVCEDFHQDLENEIDGHYDILPNYIGAAEDFLRSINEVKAALSLPRRNCDVGTVKEQTERFRRFCGTHKPQVNEFSEQGELLCPSTGCELIACNYGQCALSWEQMPYEEVK